MKTTPPAHPHYPRSLSWQFTDEESEGHTIDVMWDRLPPTEDEPLRGWFRLTRNGESEWCFRGDLVDLVRLAIQHRAASLFSMEPHKALMGGPWDLNGTPPPPSYGYQGRHMKSVWSGPLCVFTLTHDGAIKELPDYLEPHEREKPVGEFEFPHEVLQMFADDFVNESLS